MSINEEILQLIESSEGNQPYTFGSPAATFNGDDDYIRLSLFDEDNRFRDYFYSPEDITVYSDADGNPYVKPNEVLSDNFTPQGNYTLQFDFYRNINDEAKKIIHDGGGTSGSLDNSYLAITEIAPSRKEVRLVIKSDDDIFNQEQFNYMDADWDFPVHKYFKDSFESDSNGTLGIGYQFHHVLNLSLGRNILITNYFFDGSENYTSLILRLNEPLPSDVVKFNEVLINRELIQPQKQDIFYVSNISATVVSNGLAADTDYISEFTNNQIEKLFL